MLQCSYIQAFTVRFVPSMQLYRLNLKSVYRALQCLFQLFTVFYAYYPAVHPAMLYSLQGAGGHTSAQSTSSAYQIPPPRRTLYSSAQPPYYNNVYKGARVRPCYGSMPDSAAYRRPCQPGGVSSYRLRIAGKCSTRRGSPAAGAGRAARNHWRLPPYLFSGFRPIANRGQQ